MAVSTDREQEPELSSLTYAERKKKISRDKRYARYEHMLALHQAGMGQRAIAREMRMSRRIVQRYLSAEAFPERASGSGMRPRGKSKLAPYLASLRERWNAGEHTGSHVFREIKQRGYTGSESLTAACAWCMANRAAAKTQTRTPAQTASRPQAQETPSFLARRILAS